MMTLGFHPIMCMKEEIQNKEALLQKRWLILFRHAQKKKRN